MSEPSPAATSKAGAPKKPVSPVRKAISVVILVAVCIVGFFQYSAVLGYNAAVKALRARSEVEDKDLMTEAEAEKLMGDKKPDDAGSDALVDSETFTKKTYTWKGLIKTHTVTAYYRKTKSTPALHHFETDEEKYKPEPRLPAPQSAGESKSRAGGTPSQKGAGKAKPAEDKKPDDKKPDVKAEDKKADDKKPDAKADDNKADDSKKPNDTKKPDDKPKKSRREGEPLVSP